MNPFLWLLFVLAAAVVAALVAALAVGAVRMWRELPPRASRPVQTFVVPPARVSDRSKFTRDR